MTDELRWYHTPLTILFCIGMAFWYLLRAAVVFAAVSISAWLGVFVLAMFAKLLA